MFVIYETLPNKENWKKMQSSSMKSFLLSHNSGSFPKKKTLLCIYY